jgi:peptidoglycan/xylan/chitin deacetylase (PgdA/CDA1 family)
VLCYHGVSREWPSPLAITPEQLEGFVSARLAEGFRGVTFTEAVLSPGGGARLAVTFDDAYKSVVAMAAPILARLGVPGTVFVPTAYIGLDHPAGWQGTDQWLKTPWAHELEHATWDQLGELAAAGWEIGSHSRTHPHLTMIDDETLADELGESRRECERRLGACTSLAYPYGESDARVRAAAAASGYVAAANLSYRVPVGRPEPLAWPRLSLQLEDSHVAFKTWLFRHSPRGWNALQAVREAMRRVPQPGKDARPGSTAHGSGSASP